MYLESLLTWGSEEPSSSSSSCSLTQSWPWKGLSSWVCLFDCSFPSFPLLWCCFGGQEREGTLNLPSYLASGRHSSFHDPPSSPTNNKKKVFWETESVLNQSVKINSKDNSVFPSIFNSNCQAYKTIKVLWTYLFEFISAAESEKNSLFSWPKLL